MPSTLPRIWIGLVLLLGSFAACLGRAAAETAPSVPSGWLNARDVGASGSTFETTAATTAGSNEIVAAEVGDFRPGQGVMVTKCNIQVVFRLYGPGCPYGEGAARDGKDAVEIRGYDGTAGSWLVYVVEVDGADPPTFRWSDDLIRGNQWKGTSVPITWDWQPLSAGVEIRFSKRDWQPGEFVCLTARDQLITTIEKVEGNVLTLRDTANRGVQDAVVRHRDCTALQAAIDRAIQEKKHLFIPNGHYRLARSLRVNRPTSIRIEGASGTDTILDISEGAGACLGLSGGTEVTIRNLCMVGHTGTQDMAGYFQSSSGHSFWAAALKPCNAVSVGGTERVLVENVHASRMATECFFSGGPYRKGGEEPENYTKSLTFLRCSVIDCAANAFNNCDFAENTSILYCRVDGAGWHMYEGSGRFIRIIGNYIRNAGPITIGDIPHNLPRAGLRHAEELGVGQAIVRDNVLEGIGRCGGININHGPTQVIVANNLFINYNGNAINASSATVHWSFPPQNIVIQGNIIDLTCVGERNKWGVTGITVSTPDTIVSDNQVYVRGEPDATATGIRLHESAQNLSVHNNLIRNCGSGLVVHRLEGQVDEVIDATRFTVKGIPYPWGYSRFYKGWRLRWLGEGKPKTPLLADVFDNDTLQFRLAEPYEGAQAGDSFALSPPTANWQIHGNTITDCQSPVLLGGLGSDTALFRDNVISRGQATGVKQAVRVAGRFTLRQNHVVGFDEPDSVALLLVPDAVGQVTRSLIRHNTFERCTAVVGKAGEDAWKACATEGNLFIDCQAAPPTGGTIVTHEK